MRASSLSDDRVIRILTRSFVAAWSSNDDYAMSPKDQAEKDELRRVRQEATRLGLKHGQVCVFLIRPDGTPFDAMIVDQAMEPENLLPMLQHAEGRLRPRPRTAQEIRALGPPRRPAPAATVPGGLPLHVSTRFLPPADSEMGAGEDWIELKPDEWSAFPPPARASVGSKWTVPPTVADRIFRYSFPPVRTYSPDEGAIRSSSLTASLASASATTLVVELRGTFVLDHSRDGVLDGRVGANLVGVLTYDRTRKVVTSLRMASGTAIYTWHARGETRREPLGIVIESAGKGAAIR
jgi:hypothetical protein